MLVLFFIALKFCKEKAVHNDALENRFWLCFLSFFSPYEKTHQFPIYCTNTSTFANETSGDCTNSFEGLENIMLGRWGVSSPLHLSFLFYSLAFPNIVYPTLPSTDCKEGEKYVFCLAERPVKKLWEGWGGDKNRETRGACVCVCFVVSGLRVCVM